MKFVIEKTKQTCFCSGSNCKKDPKYFINFNEFFGPVIKANINVVVFYTISDHPKRFCPDCVDELYLKLKPILNRELWNFE